MKLQFCNQNYDFAPFPEIGISQVLHMRFRNKKVEGIVIPICLPLRVMERFECEIKRMTKEAKPTRFITSMF